MNTVRMTFVRVGMVAVLASVASSSSQAAKLRPGDLVVVNAFGGLVKVDPTTGMQTAIPSGPFEQPTDVCLDVAGNIIVTDFDGSVGSSGAIYRVDPTTGTTTTISSGGLLALPISSAIDAEGNLIVVQQGHAGDLYSVIKINPTTGVQTPVASGRELFATISIIVEPDGNYLVSNWQNSFVGGSSIVRVNATTGLMSVVSIGGELDYGPFGIQLDRTNQNTILTTHSSFDDPSGAKLLAIDRLTGSQSVVAREGLLQNLTDVTQDAKGNIFVTDFDTHRIITIDRLTGAQTILSSGASLYQPVAIVAVIPEPSTLLLASVAFGGAFLACANRSTIQQRRQVKA